MSGINRIQNLREETRTAVAQRNATPFREIWFRDGDQAFVTSVATGADDDVLLDEISLYTFRSGTRFVNLLNEDGVDLSSVPGDVRPSRKFAFDGPGGRKMYKEVVNDYKIVCLGFGRNDYLWNQLVDVFNDWDSLDKGVMRIKRTGAGLDTSYAIATTARDSEIPADALMAKDDLPPIKEYFRERYGALWVPGPSGDNGATQVKAETGFAELF